MANDLRARLGLKDGGPVKMADGGADLRTRLKLGGGGKVPKVAEALREAATASRTAIKTKQTGLSAQERAENLAKFLSDSKIKERLYHATPGNFKEFKPGGKDPTLSGPAIWLSADPKHQPAMHNISAGEGKFREGVNVMPVHVQAKNPLVLDDPVMIDWAREVFADGSREFPELLPPKWVEEVRKEGYDSILFADPFGKGQTHEIIMFEPNKIKSALGNEGTYDTSVPDITKAAGGVVHMQDGGKTRKIAGALAQAAQAAKALTAAERKANLDKFLEPSAVQMRLYHGTTATEGGKGQEAIRQFKPSKEGALGSGVYMTPKADYAGYYAVTTPYGAPPSTGGHVLPVYAQMRNPLVISGEGDPMIEALVKLGLDENKASRLVERAYENKGYIGKEVETRAKAAGYDGLVQYRDGELAEVVSYNPSAIKSALGNEGTYDTSVPLLNKAAGGEVHMQDGGSPLDRFAGRAPKRGVSSLPGYGQGNVLQSIEGVMPRVAGGLDVLLTGAPVVAKALTSPAVSLGTFVKEAAASGDPRDTGPLQRAREASQEYITGNIRLPQTETGTDYLLNIAEALENLPDFKIPPIIPQMMTMPSMPGMGAALKDVAKTAGKAKIPDVTAPKPVTMPSQGVSYETTTEGPFYRVRPSVSQAPAGQRRGTLESDGTQAGYAVTGRTGSDVPQPITDEAVRQVMADPANFVRRSADTYVQDVLGKPYELPDVPESSIFKQAPIGRTFMLAASDDPAYKQTIFEQYARQMPDVIKQSGAKNYDELVAAAYRQMAKETDEQFKRLPISLSYHRAGEGNYRNSKQMLQDVYGNKHLYVFQGGDEHPYLKAIDPETGLNENEKFRAVHDFFGHAIHGNEFGPKGEETAWAAHSQMYSPLARLAMSTETRGQNSTVNYTPLNAMVKRTINELNMQRYEANRRGKTDMVKEIDAQLKQAWNDFQFAPQKPLLLPPEFLNPRYEGSMPDYLRPLIKPEAGTTVSTPLTHYSKQAGLAETDPAFYGTGIKGEEAARLDLPGAIRPRTYFYAGEGITPEPGLGPNRYRAMGENLYDLAADPLMLNLLARETTRIPMTASSNKGLAQPGEATNALERLIRDYGYAGYLSPQSTKPSAVMFGKTPVQPYAKGGKVRFTDDPDVQGMVVHMAKGGSKPAAVAEALKEAAKATKAAQKVGPPTPAALQRAEAAERALRKQKGFENMRPSDQEMAVQAARAKALGVGLERSTVGLEAALPGEKDIARSLMSVPAYKKADAVPISAIEEAKQRRAIYRQEPAMTPGPKASEKEWEKWGKSFGVNMTLTKPESVNISDPLSKREIKIPGGLEGTFTIPDMFWMKANNVNPAALPKDVHDQLMLKFIRTHNVSNPDEVDIFNRLNFALLSPNAPLTQNEFLAMRARIRDMDELRELAARKGEKGLAQNLADEMGVSSASKGGLGILGTANLGNQAELARLILQKPEMFQIQPGETMRDVTMRVMNQVPGLGPKTASLGTPWIDLERANTSAVDLHMIRDAWPRLLNDPDVGPAFRERIANLLGVEPTVEAILSQPPNKIQEKAVQVIGGTDVSRMYRTRQGGLSNIPESATPEKLVFEPKKFREFNPFYNKVVEYVDESRGADPLLELFPEQWRKWDVLRKRIEPHEFAHPDYRLLPKSSFNEMQAALEAHKKAGYTGKKPVMGETDWRKLYYGAFAPVGVGLGAAALSEMDTGMATE